MKKINLTIILVLVIGIIATVNSIYQKNYIVEDFCAVKYEYNVQNYKSCKKLTPNKLIIKLTKDEKESINKQVPTIPLVLAD